MRTSPKYCCCWYHKGTNFQANHNLYCVDTFTDLVVADTTKVRIFKQITTSFVTDIQLDVVADTTKVRIFKQITTALIKRVNAGKLLLIPQRYEFSSKSQRCEYGKNTKRVVADTTKVRIFKQITTDTQERCGILLLLLIPQRYEFSSKSQLLFSILKSILSCCWYHKGTNFQANHNVRVSY